MTSPKLTRLHFLPYELRVLIGEFLRQSAALNDEISVVGYLKVGNGRVLETLAEFLKRTGLMKTMIRKRRPDATGLWMNQVSTWYTSHGWSRHVWWNNCTAERWHIQDVHLTSFLFEVRYPVKVWETKEGYQKKLPLKAGHTFPFDSD